MHSEHLTNLHPGWALGGWLIAVAVTSGIYLALVGTGLLPLGPGMVLGIALAMGIGFYAGGLFVGFRWSSAPILHAGAITFISVVVWFLGSLARPGSFTEWTTPSPAAPGILLLQFVSASAGGWHGRTMSGGGTQAGAS